VYSDGRKVTIKIPFRVPSVNSVTKAAPFLLAAGKTLSIGFSTGLQEAHVFNDTATNKTIITFTTDYLGVQMVLILPLNHLEKFNQFRIGSYSSSNSY
jgi:hypothetical protein